MFSFFILCLCLSSVLSKEIINPLQNNTNLQAKDVVEKDVSSQRNCPTCSGIACDANMTISGLPVIQVLIALAAGIIWAKIFVWIFKSFSEKGNHNESTPQYGVPTEQYGAPAPTQYGAPAPQYGPPQTQYGPPQSQYGAPTSRALNIDFLDLTKRVLEAINEFTES